MKKYSVETKKAIFRNGEKFTDYEFDNVFRTKHGIVGYGKNFIHIFYKDEPVIIEKNMTVCSYEENCQYFLVSNKQGKQGLLRENGQIIIPLEYDYIDYEFSFKFIYVEKKEQYGIYSFSGKEIIPCAFDSIQVLEEVGFKVEKDFSFGLFSLSGKVILPINFKSIEIDEKVIIAKNNDDFYGLYSKNGKMLLKPVYDMIIFSSFSQYLYVCEIGLWGLYSLDGRCIVPTNFSSRNDIDTNNGTNYIIVKKDKLYGAYSQEGKLVIPIKHKSAWTILNNI